MDHSEYKELTPDELMQEMGLKKRAVYQHIDKNKWEKKTGFQGRVTYLVPSAYIAEYVANTQRYKSNANDEQMQIPSIAPVAQEQNKVQTQPTESEFLKEFYEIKAKLDVANERMAEKDKLIAHLEGRVESEKDRAEMAKNEAQNMVQALIRRNENTQQQQNSEISNNVKPFWKFW